MKLTIIIILLSFGHISVAQKQQDTTISIRSLDSMKTVIYNVKTANKLNFFKNRLAENKISVDTTYPKRDSIVISYYSVHRKLLQRTIKKYARPDCVSYETTEYFNDKELPEYLEYWNCSCSTGAEKDPEVKYFDKLLNHYERYEYDSIGRITIKVFWYPMPGARRVEYKYDLDGNATTTIKKISQNEFWD